MTPAVLREFATSVRCAAEGKGQQGRCGIARIYKGRFRSERRFVQHRRAVVVYQQGNSVEEIHAHIMTKATAEARRYNGVRVWKFNQRFVSPQRDHFECSISSQRNESPIAQLLVVSNCIMGDGEVGLETRTVTLLRAYAGGNRGVGFNRRLEYGNDMSRGHSAAVACGNHC